VGTGESQLQVPGDLHARRPGRSVGRAPRTHRRRVGARADRRYFADGLLRLRTQRAGRGDGEVGAGGFESPQGTNEDREMGIEEESRELKNGTDQDQENATLRDPPEI